jgi:hypothetical protein
MMAGTTYAKWLYWIVLLGAQLYISYLLFTNSRPIAGVIWLVVGIVLIWAFYPIYFPPGGPGSKWPPYVSACPDYLTQIGPNSCVDYVGLNSPVLQKADPTNPPQPTDTKHIFDSSGTMSQKAAKAQQYGLSWEGVA